MVIFLTGPAAGAELLSQGLIHGPAVRGEVALAWDALGDEIGDAGFLSAVRDGAVPSAWEALASDAYDVPATGTLGDGWLDSAAKGSRHVRAGAQGAGVTHDYSSVDAVLSRNTAERAVTWRTQMTSTQVAAMNRALELGAGLPDDEAAFMLRRSVGLTPGEVSRLFAQRAALLEDAPGLGADPLRTALTNGSGGMRDTRLRRIVRAEFTDPFNFGVVSTASALEEAGKLITVTKVWIAQFDGAVCPICEDLHGVSATLDGLINGLDSPPAHLGCRCYLEIQVESVAVSELSREAREVTS